jgi:hypothetical protein
MPSKSKAQRNLMAAAAHNPAFAKKVGVPVSVAQEFNKADKGKKFKGGGMMDKKDIKQDKAMAKKAVGMHEKQLHGGKKSDLAALKKGGNVKKMAMGGAPAMPARSTKANPIEAKHTLKYGQSLPMKKGTGPSAYAVANKLPPKPKARGTTTSDLPNVGGVNMRPSFANTPGKVRGMKSGGCAKMAKGGGIEVRGKTKGKII